MGGIEPGTPITTATLTYLARVKIGWMLLLYPFITKVDFTDNIHQGQNRSHSKYFLDTIRGSNIHPISTLFPRGFRPNSGWRAFFGPALFFEFLKFENILHCSKCMDYPAERIENLANSSGI